VSAHVRRTPYHRYAWREAMQAGYQLETHYLIAETEDGAVCGVLPAARVPRPLGRGTLCSLPYCDRGEPLADNASIEAALKETLQQCAGGRHEVRGTSTADDRPSDDDATKAPVSGSKVRLLLDLPPSSEELLASLKSKLRSQVRKAQKNGLTADIGNSPERVTAFYEIFQRNMRELGSPTHSLSWFNAVSQAYKEDASIALVYSDETVVGAGFVLRCGDITAIPWASTLREYNRLAPNMLLYWTLLAEAADKGMRRFDFGRSTVGEGTYRFKTQWGAQPVPLRWMPDAESSEGPSIVRKLAENTWRHLPLSLTSAMGSRLRPYISL